LSTRQKYEFGQVASKARCVARENTGKQENYGEYGPEV
jgi:hypothetical protein